MISAEHNGVRRTKYDWHDFLLHPTFGTSKDGLPGLPSQGIGRTPGAIKNQGVSNFCTAFGISSASEYQEGVLLSPEYQAAKEGQIAGAPIFNGADAHTALKSVLDYGSLPAVNAPFSFDQNGWAAPTVDWHAYGTEFDRIASTHKKQSYYRVTYGFPDDMDAFDSIRLALWDAKDDNGVVIAFGYWYQEWNGTGPDGIASLPTTPISRHCYLFIDFTTINGVEYLIAQLSSGPGFAADGLVYFSREVVNYAWKNPFFYGLGLYIFRDTQEQPATSFSFGAFVANAIGVVLSFIGHV